MEKRIALQVAGWYEFVPVPVGGVYEALIHYIPNTYLLLALLTYLEYTNNKYKRSL